MLELQPAFKLKYKSSSEQCCRIEGVFLSDEILQIWACLWLIL